MTGVPRLLLVTDRLQTAGRPLDEVVTECVSGGVDHVLVRERDLSTASYDGLLARVRQRVGTGVTVLGRDARSGSSACQLSSDAPWPPLRPALIGRSVHDTDGVRRAADEGADFVVAGPFAATTSKPGYGPALGLRGIQALVDQAGGLPLLAVGGVRPTDLAPLAAVGATGAAVMGPLMRARAPRAVAREYVEAAQAFRPD